MTLEEFKKAYSELPDEKSATLEKFSKRLVKEGVDVSFLRDEFIRSGKYFYIYQYVSILSLDTLPEKFRFIESTFDVMNDWTHTDLIMKLLGDKLTFDYAYTKARGYVCSEYPYARRLGYVIFIPRLTKDIENLDRLFSLLKDDEFYHVVMGEAWLISFLAMCSPDRTYEYLKGCTLKYNIVGKAIQKICDSYVIEDSWKEKFRGLRDERKKIR